MPIKNLDGSVYKLQGVNPITKNQNQWKNFVLHNCKWVDRPKDTPPAAAGGVSYHNLTCTKVKTEAASEVDILKIKKAMNIQDQPTKVQEQPKTVSIGNNFGKSIIIMHCLPAVFHVDTLYGEKRLKYAEKFTFESIIVEVQELNMRFWTNIDIEAKSVVFPWKFKTGELVKEHSWWKILSRIEKSGGFIYKTIISDIQPDFT